MNKKALFLFLLLFVSSSYAQTPAFLELIKQYQSQGASLADIKQGQELWQQTFQHKNSNKDRSCRLCHGTNLKQNGKHIKTGKIIKPLAPSVNANSLTQVKKIKKWIKRNCKWTIGRECTAQEKVNLLSYISAQ